MSDSRRSDSFGFMPVNERGMENPCFECGVITKGLHHVVPVSLGGTKQIPLCEDCHNKVHGGLINSGLIREGLRKAREKGAKFGAPMKITPETRNLIIEMKKNGMKMRDIGKKLNISVGSVYNALKMKE